MTRTCHDSDDLCPPHAARRRRSAGDGTGPLQRRPAAAEPGLCRLRALAARACAHRVGERGGRQEAKGVLAVLTAADIKAAGIGSLVAASADRGRGGAKMATPFRPGARGEKVMLCRRRGRDGGRGNAAARRYDAADLVVGRVRGTARRRRAPRRDEARRAAIASPTRPAISPSTGPGPVPSEDNEREVATIIAEAPHVARVDSHQSAHGGRLDGDARRHRRLRRGERELHAACLLAERRRAARAGARPSWACRTEKLRVHHRRRRRRLRHEDAVLSGICLRCWSARAKTGRPVHWQSTRSEAFITDTQARDTVTEAELALDENGKFLALRMRHLCNQGGYVSPAGAGINTNNFARCLPGMYRIPKVDVSVALLLHQHGADRALSRRRPAGSELRARARRRRSRAHHGHRSRAPAQEEPDPEIGHALQDRGRQHLRQRRFPRHRRPGAAAGRLRRISTSASASSAKRKKLRGIGVSCMLEHAGAMPTESASLNFAGDGKLVMGLNVQSTGQSHATVFGRVVADRARHRSEDNRAPAWR